MDNGFDPTAYKLHDQRRTVVKNAHSTNPQMTRNTPPVITWEMIFPDHTTAPGSRGDETSTLSTFSCDPHDDSWLFESSESSIDVTAQEQDGRKRRRLSTCDDVNDCRNQTSDGHKYIDFPALETSSIFVSDCDSIELFEKASCSLGRTCSSLQALVPPTCMEELPDELVCQISSFLDVGSLKQSRLLNRRFKGLCEHNDAGWSRHCQLLWSRKFNVSPLFRNDLQYGNPQSAAMVAYRNSCLDAQIRQELHDGDELLYDPNTQSGAVWHFRFKEAAGAGWTSFDPWHAGSACRQLVFLASGEVRQLVPETGELRLAFYDNEVDTNALEVRWRYVYQPMDLPEKPRGAYVRLSVGGRDVPTYIVHRSPNGNWGFLMENCWGVFASFPLPAKLVANNRPSRAINSPGLLANGRFLPSPLSLASEDDGYVDDRAPESARMSSLEAMDDLALMVTNRLQWREALMYNFGASVLPDGPDGAASFRRAWQASVQGEHRFRQRFPQDMQNFLA